jgi:hypothetical protein
MGLVGGDNNIFDMKERQVLSNIWATKDENLDLPSLYRIPKLHKCPFKQHVIAGSAKCSAKPHSQLLTCIPSPVNIGLQSYCDTSYSMGENKIRPFLAQGICIYVGHIIFKHSWTSSLNLSFSLESGIVV